MWTNRGYFEQQFWKRPDFNIKFGKKPILAQNSLCGCSNKMADYGRILNEVG